MEEFFIDWVQQEQFVPWRSYRGYCNLSSNHDLRRICSIPTQVEKYVKESVIQYAFWGFQSSNKYQSWDQ
jgi:hypothetical protein